MNKRAASKVNINRNPEVAEGDTLTYPLHRIIGVLPTEQSAWQVIGKLKARGVPEDEMELWTIEQVHRTLKDELGAGVHLSGKFGANAACLRLQASPLRSSGQAVSSAERWGGWYGRPGRCSCGWRSGCWRRWCGAGDGGTAA